MESKEQERTEWLREIMLDVLYDSACSAEQQVAKILAHPQVDALLRLRQHVLDKAIDDFIASRSAKR